MKTHHNGLTITRKAISTIINLLNVLKHRNQLISAGGVFLANRIILIVGILGVIS